MAYSVEEGLVNVTVSEGVGLNSLEDRRQLGGALLQRSVGVRVGVPDSLDIRGEVAEEEGVVLANILGNFYYELFCDDTLYSPMLAPSTVPRSRAPVLSDKILERMCYR